VKVLVCGGRDFYDVGAVHRALDDLQDERGPIRVLIHGQSRGADLIAAGWALTAGVAPLAYPADWNRHGRAAGPIRNAAMLADGNPDLVVAFPGGRGTAHMVGLARKAGVEVLVIPRNTITATPTPMMARLWSLVHSLFHRMP